MKPEKMIIVGVLILLLSSAGFLSGETWVEKRLTNNSGSSVYPTVAASGSNIDVVWQDDTPGNNEVYFKKSTNGGAAWQNSKRLTYNSGSSEAPVIAVSGLNIYVVWFDDTPGNFEIYFKKSANGGASWQPSKRLTQTAGGSYKPVIAASGSNVYVLWSDDTPGNPELYLTISTDGGAAWQTAQKITNNAGSSYRPAVAVSGSNIYVAWEDSPPAENFEIYFMKSADGGASWQTAKRLTHNAEASYEAAIAVSGPNVYIGWYDLKAGNAEIYFLKSPNRGVSWKALNRLTYNNGSSCCPAIAASGSNIHVVWYDSTPGNCEIFLATSLNGGTSWKTAERLSNNSGTSWNPAVAVSGSNIYVVWQDLTPGNNEIYLTKSTGLEPVARRTGF